MPLPSELQEAYDYIKKDLVWLEGFISNCPNDESRKIAIRRIDVIRRHLKTIAPLKYEIHPATREPKVVYESIPDPEFEKMLENLSNKPVVSLGDFFLPGQP